MADDISELTARYTYGTWRAQRGWKPLHITRAEGCHFWDASGKRYLDLSSQLICSNLGHQNQAVIDAICAQAKELAFIGPAHTCDVRAKAALKLLEVMPKGLEKFFFATSGTEANEAAIKMARKYHAANGEPERFRVITFEGAFHGRTLATIAAGGQKKYLEGFGPKVEGFDQVPFDDIPALKQAIVPETAAIMIEPIQGEGGIRPVPTAFIREIRNLCDEHGLLLIFDEIQTGVGRTGKFFAYEWMGVAPDIMAIAKGIGGGFPMGACLATAEASKGMTVGTHGTTFGGNPLAMAVGNAVLDVVLEPGFLQRVEQMGLLVKQRLAELKDRHPAIIADVRGHGLMVGIKTHILNSDFINAARDEKLILIAAGDNVARMLPPLIITEAEIGEAMNRIDAACARLEAELQAIAKRGAAE